MRDSHLVTALREQDLKLVDLASRLGVNKSTASRWARKVPAERVLDIERTCGIDRTVLRPDLYPPASPAPVPESVS
ncbi:MAG: helix-turn-helix domain-containing protein [Afipia sp.]|nr:helix-turn-helix domain-containing protein [Afipia sp.]MBR2535782.1 helix-turn-helix domain-containing protein [Hyphomicrobium sp.]